MTVKTKYTSRGNCTAEYPFFESAEYDTSAMNAFSERLALEAEKAAEKLAGMGGGVRLHLGYRKAEPDGKLHIIYVIELRRRGARIRRREISVVWREGLIDECAARELI